MSHQKRELLGRLLTGYLPRPARRFLDLLLPEAEILARMYLCRPEERAAVRHSVWISTEYGCWSVLLGNDPAKGARSAQARARLALEGLDLTPGEVVERLRSVPVWFLALDEQDADIPAGEAARIERTLGGLAALRPADLRRRVLMDQLDAALDAGDRVGFDRIRRLLGP